jgi:hypothetical protein
MSEAALRRIASLERTTRGSYRATRLEEAGNCGRVLGAIERGIHGGEGRRSGVEGRGGGARSRERLGGGNGGVTGRNGVGNGCVRGEAS